MAPSQQLLDGRRTRLDADPARSFTLPGWAYTDPEVFEREKREIFYKSWLYAGSLDELKEPGDYVTARILDQGVVVVRGKDGSLRGFYNVCQHRAHELLAGQGNAKAIVCPYHAWSYQLDGRLRTARGAEKLPGFDADAFCLKPVRIEVFAKRFVFYNLDPAAAPLAELAGDLAAEIEAEVPGFDRLVPGGEERWSTLKANWKVVVDNFLECYHCGPAHPAFADLVDMQSYRISTTGLWSSQKGRVGRLDNKAYVVSADDESQVARFWWLWPCTTFNVLPGEAGLFVFAMQPEAPGLTNQGGRRYSPPGTVPNPARLAYGNEVLGPEDNAICESVQRGLASRGYDAGRFIHDPDGGQTTEAAVHHFHRLVADVLDI